MKRCRIRRVTSLRRKQNELYLRLRKEYLEQHPYCECGCGRLATEIHHRAGRRAEWLTYAPLFMACASICHKWIERNRRESESKGWVIRIRETFKEYMLSHPEP